MASLSFCRQTVYMTMQSLSRTLGRSRYGASSRKLSFSFAGPRTLEEVLKKDLFEDKTGSEVSDLWKTYHSGKENMIGLSVNGKVGTSVLSRAGKNPFFIQPIFRNDGFFMLISQFQAPTHFLMAYLEDYKMDPHSATPLLTFSVFDDYAETKEICLVRCDVLNKNISDDECEKVVGSLLDNYGEDDNFGLVEMFNKQPDSFDVDDFLSRMNDRWKHEG